MWYIYRFLANRRYIDVTLAADFVLPQIVFTVEGKCILLGHKRVYSRYPEIYKKEIDKNGKYQR